MVRIGHVILPSTRWTQVRIRSQASYDSLRVGMTDTAPAKSDCVEFLSLLEEPKRRQVLAGSKRVTSPAGTTGFLPDAPNYAAVIDRGLIRVYIGDGGGRQATAFYRHRGELLTIGLVKRPAINLYVQAVTDIEVTSLDVNLLRSIIDRACANQLVSGKLVVHASQQQLADSIGSVREVVARSLRKLREDRIIATAPNVVRVPDIERLEDIATQLSAN